MRGHWGNDSVKSQWCSDDLTLAFEDLTFLKKKKIQERISGR